MSRFTLHELVGRDPGRQQIVEHVADTTLQGVWQHPVVGFCDRLENPAVQELIEAEDLSVQTLPGIRILSSRGGISTVRGLSERDTRGNRNQAD